MSLKKETPPGGCAGPGTTAVARKGVAATNSLFLGLERSSPVPWQTAFLSAAGSIKLAGPLTTKSAEHDNKPDEITLSEFTSASILPDILQSNSSTATTSSLNTPTMEVPEPLLFPREPLMSSPSAVNDVVADTTLLVTDDNHEVLGEFTLPVVTSQPQHTGPPPLSIEELWGGGLGLESYELGGHAPAAVVEGKTGSDGDVPAKQSSLSDPAKLELEDMDTGVAIGEEVEPPLDSETFQHVLESITGPDSGEWDFNTWCLNSPSPVSSKDTVSEMACPAAPTLGPADQIVVLASAPTAVFSSLDQTGVLHHTEDVTKPTTIEDADLKWSPSPAAISSEADIESTSSSEPTASGSIQPRKRGRPPLPFNRIIPPKAPRTGSASGRGGCSTADTTSDDQMTDQDVDTMRYNRMRALNNEASKRCRAKRKEKIVHQEIELADETKRNNALKAKLAELERKVKEVKNAFHHVVGSGSISGPILEVIENL